MPTNNSYAGMYQQAKTLKSAATTEEAKNLYSQQMGSAIGGGALTAVSGLSGILDTSLQMVQVPDTSAYESQIDHIGDFRNSNTYDINELISQRAAATPNVKIDYDSVDGISDGGIATGTLSNTLSGASTGYTIGGPWGAVIGGFIGAASGIYSGHLGKKLAEEKVDTLKSLNKYQQDLNDQYFYNQANKIQDYQFDQMYAYRAAEGGRIHIKKKNRGKFTEAAKKHHMTVQQFANYVLSNKNKGKYSATMRKRANFARVAAGWSH